MLELTVGDTFSERFKDGTLHAIYLIVDKSTLPSGLYACESIEVIGGGFRRYNHCIMFLRDEFVYEQFDSKRYFALKKAIKLVQLQLEAYNKA